ncbi:MAG TPA: anti-sigma factor, partial [Acidimicrobiia bacterium]|nr:anti-sigma factor [Acidimicrobiia bacterium]
MSAMPDDRLAELLGAYALDACDPDETAAIEELLRRRPDLAAEAARLTAAAAWLGATEALEPPARLRDAVFAAADVPRYEDAAG